MLGHYGEDVSVLLNNGDGTFAPEQRFSLRDSSGPITTQDLNRDGWFDLLTASYGGPGVMVTLTDAKALADFDGDGVADLATVNRNSNDVSVRLGMGDGTFAQPQQFEVGDTPASLRVGDVHGDGTLEVITANDGSDDVSVLLGNGDGMFAQQQRFEAGTAPVSLAMGDLDGDGNSELVAVNTPSDWLSEGFSISLFQWQGDGMFEKERLLWPHWTDRAALEDLDGDGFLDLVAIYPEIPRGEGGC